MAKPRRTSKQSKQAGGTFLGVVLGLIVGLAIAVVVALYITRAPSPFVAKVPAPAENEASGAQPFNPNRALQGSSPAAQQAAQPNAASGQSPNQPPILPAPQIVEVPASGTAPQAPGANPNAGEQNGIAVAPAPAPGSQQKPATTANIAPQQHAPAGSAATAAKPPSAPSAAEANSGYFLQVGAYRTASDAEQQRARLGFQGFESKVTKRDVNGVTYYRVRIGPFAKFDDMNSARQRLSDAGINTAVIRFTKQ